MGQGDFDIKVIHNQTELLQTLGVSASVEARTGFFKGGAAYSNKRSYSFSDDSIVWTLSSKTVLGRYRLKNPRANALLASLNAGQALRRCGPEFVTEETRGAIIAVVYQATNISSAQKEELTASISAAYKGPNKYSARSAYQSAIQKILQTSSISHEIHYRGGPGEQILAQAVSEPENLVGLGTALATYIKGLTPANARPLLYQTSALSQFSDVQVEAAPNTDEDRLWDIYEIYAKVTALIKRIDVYIRPIAEDEKHIAAGVNEAKRNDLQKVRNRYEKARDHLRIAALACLEHAAGCEMPQLAELPRVDWPRIPPPPEIIKACEIGGLGFAFRGQPPVGAEVIVSTHITYMINAEPDAVASVYRIEGQNRQLLELKPASKKSTSATTSAGAALVAALAAEEMDTWLPKDCVSQLDRSRAAGSVSVSISKRYKQPSGVRLEVIDIYGRKSILEIDERVEELK